MNLEATCILDTAFKDDSPLKTVERIKHILKTYGIETEEQWNNSGVPNCYSVSVSANGTVFGTNGKGVTKELALASGYGEFMERLQLGRIFKSDQQKDGGLYSGCAIDTKLSIEELLSKNRKWYRLYAKRAKEATGVELTEEDILKQYCDEEGKIPVTSFFCVNSRTWEYLPVDLVKYVYTTNGGAAGNTPEEAIVQALSEILERQFSSLVLAGEIPVPDIQEERLRSCKIAYEIITFLREQNFKVVVKDCSLGTKFPVVCVCLVDQKTGKYHTHFGAYPNFEIALQRTLTETFQGRNLLEVAKFEDFAQSAKGGTADLENLLTQLAKGTSEKTPEFFIKSSEPYQQPCGFSGANNRELLKECIDFIAEQGYDILVRDYSCLGFPTYQVIIPGFSEIFAHRIVPAHNDLRYQQFVQSVLRNPTEAKSEEILGFMMNRTQVAKKKPFTNQANLPAKLSPTRERYLMYATLASINYAMQRNGEALKYINKMLSEDVEENFEQLLCIKRYMALLQNGYDKTAIQNILEYFHQTETVQWLFAMVSENKNLLESFTLHCDMQCRQDCLLYGCCVKKQTDALAQIIRTKQEEMNHFLLQEQFEKLFLNEI